MTYAETISYLYAAAPLFQQVGGAAYKEGLSTTETLDRHFNHPHRQFRTVHVAGTNGKGSCAHTLAAMLQHRGLKVGLYTSPHLIDFRERIRVNGMPVPEQYVVDFVAREKDFFEPLHPSFFELTTAMAFCYFAEAGVDVAVVEVGMGGRLDCTNIIRPELCIITNISLDHTQFLGETLADIAREKAGIMKHGVPALVGEALPETRPVFEAQAATVGAPLSFAQDTPEILATQRTPEGLRRYETRHWGTFLAQLSADCQICNTETLLHAAALLRPVFGIAEEDVHYAFRPVCEATGLMGRWQPLRTHPLTVCDTGHNLGGWQYLSLQLREAIGRHPAVRVVFGMAADKDVESVLRLLPPEAHYFWAQASVRRALPAEELSRLAASLGLHGTPYPTVAEAYAAAAASASKDDFVYIGGSCFVVADLLASLA